MAKRCSCSPATELKSQRKPSHLRLQGRTPNLLTPPFWAAASSHPTSEEGLGPWKGELDQLSSREFSLLLFYFQRKDVLTVWPHLLWRALVCSARKGPPGSAPLQVCAATAQGPSGACTAPTHGSCDKDRSKRMSSAVGGEGPGRAGREGVGSRGRRESQGVFLFLFFCCFLFFVFFIFLWFFFVCVCVVVCYTARS